MYLSRDILCICKQTHIAILFLLVTYVIACHTITRYLCVCVSGWGMRGGRLETYLGAGILKVCPQILQY